jgi:hypothetical protein
VHPVLAQPKQPRPGVNLANYERITEGMPQVVDILGKQGTEGSRVSLAGITTVIYQWNASGLAGLRGGNMNATFQNGRLVGKAQAGLS